jgi:hypothetical protein
MAFEKTSEVGRSEWRGLRWRAERGLREALWQAEPNDDLRARARKWLDEVAADHGSWTFIWQALWQASTQGAGEPSVSSNSRSNQLGRVGFKFFCTLNLPSALRD